MLSALANWASTTLALLGIVIAFPLRRGTAEKPRRDTPQANCGTPSGVTSLIRRFKTPQKQSQAPIRIPNRALTPAEHFSRTSQVIAAALRSTALAGDLHQQARVQLEVVEFSIDRILEEVAEVMTLTPEMQRRFQPALVPFAAGGRRRAA